MKYRSYLLFLPIFALFFSFSIYVFGEGPDMLEILPVTENLLPHIISQPADVIAPTVGVVSFLVEAEGTDLKYQWQTSIDGGNSWVDSRLPGSNTACLSVEVFESRNGYQFRCIVMSNNASVISNAAELTINNNYETEIQLTSEGKKDMIWSYPLSMNPIVLTDAENHDKVYWGYTTHDGYSGVACYDLRTGNTVKTHLKYGEVDDHNNTSIYIKDGHVIVSYTNGHNNGNIMNYRLSTEPESIDSFEPVFQYSADGETCYGQFFESDDVLYSFFRLNNQQWCCLVSYDLGATWGNIKTIITATTQYYCKIQKTTVEGLLRLCMYGNPAGPDPSIRMGFLDLNSGNIYKNDAVTVLGDWEKGVECNKFDPIIIPEDTQRLFDVAITDPHDISILICEFSMKSIDDGVYMWFNNGELTKICDAGQSFWYPKYQNGIVFYGTDKAIVGRSDKKHTIDGKDYIEIWNLESEPTLEKEIYSEEKGETPTRNIRPIVDQNNRVIIWQRGYYDPHSYNHFNMDVMIYLIDENRIV